MKIILLFVVFTAALTSLAQNRPPNQTVAETADTLKKELDLKTSQKVESTGFSVEVPAGWSYLISDYSKKHASSRGDYRSRQSTTAEIIMAPTSNVGFSEIFLSVRNYFPQAYNIDERRKLFKDSGVKFGTKKFQGRDWQVLEYAPELTDDQKAKKKTYNWYATTEIKGGTLTISAGAPTIESRDKYRAQFEAIMKSVKVTE